MMPSRILREGILTSEAVNSLTPQAEVFYRRLMSIVDDFGRYDGRPAILLSQLYSLQLDRVTVKDISDWLADTISAGLIVSYVVDNKPFIEVLKFEKKPRAKHSKWPANPSTCAQMRADENGCAQMRPYSYSNSNAYSSSNTPLPPNVGGAVQAAETDGVLPPVEPAENVPAISDRFTLADIKNILAGYPLKMNMHAAKLRVSYALTDIANDPAHPGQANPVAWLTARVEAYAKSRLGKRKPKNPADWFADRRYDDADEAWNAGATDKELEAQERQRKAAGHAAAMEEARKRRLKEEAKAMAEAEKDNRSLIEIKNKAIAEAARRNRQTPPTLANVIAGVKV